MNHVQDDFRAVHSFYSSICMNLIRMM